MLLEFRAVLILFELIRVAALEAVSRRDKVGFETGDGDVFERLATR